MTNSQSVEQDGIVAGNIFAMLNSANRGVNRMRKKMLGCNLCKNISSLNCKRTQGLSASTEWITCQVKCYGDTVKKRQVSLRKKIYIHKTSEYHKRAESLVNEKEADHLLNAVAKQQHHLYDTTARVLELFISR